MIGFDVGDAVVCVNATPFPGTAGADCPGLIKIRKGMIYIVSDIRSGKDWGIRGRRRSDILVTVQGIEMPYLASRFRKCDQPGNEEERGIKVTKPKKDKIDA